IRVATKSGLARDRICRQEPADIRGRHSTQDELTADREEAGFREVDPERKAFAVSAKGNRAQLDFGIEVLARALAGGAKASTKLGSASILGLNDSAVLAAHPKAPEREEPLGVGRKRLESRSGGGAPALDRIAPFSDAAENVDLLGRGRRMSRGV